MAEIHFDTALDITGAKGQAIQCRKETFDKREVRQEGKSVFVTQQLVELRVEGAFMGVEVNKHSQVLGHPPWRVFSSDLSPISIDKKPRGIHVATEVIECGWIRQAMLLAKNFDLLQSLIESHHGGFLQTVNGRDSTALGTVPWVEATNEFIFTCIGRARAGNWWC